jgi:hypothetical protein
MKLANLHVDGAALMAVVDADRSVFWPVSALVPDFNGDMVQLVQSFGQIKGDLRPRGEGRPLSRGHGAGADRPAAPQHLLRGQRTITITQPSSRNRASTAAPRTENTHRKPRSSSRSRPARSSARA